MCLNKTNNKSTGIKIPQCLIGLNESQSKLFSSENKNRYYVGAITERGMQRVRDK